MEPAIYRYLALQHYLPFQRAMREVRGKRRIWATLDSIDNSEVKSKNDFEHRVHRNVKSYGTDASCVTIDWAAVRDDLYYNVNRREYSQQDKAEADEIRFHVLHSTQNRRSKFAKLKRFYDMVYLELHEIEDIKTAFLAELTFALGKVIDRFLPITKYGLPSKQLFDLLFARAGNPEFLILASSGGVSTVEGPHGISGVSNKLDYEFNYEPVLYDNADQYGLLAGAEIAYLKTKLQEYIGNGRTVEAMMVEDGFTRSQYNLAQVLLKQRRFSITVHPSLPKSIFKEAAVLKRLEKSMESISSRLKHKDQKYSIATIAQYCELYADAILNKNLTYNDVNEIHYEKSLRAIYREIGIMLEATGFGKVKDKK